MELVIVDGGNKNGTYGSYIIVDSDGNIQDHKGMYWGIGDHNQAEYWILLVALKRAHDFGYKDIIIFTDSETVAEQVAFERPLHSNRLRKIRRKILVELSKFNSWEVRKVDRKLIETFLGH